MDVAKGKERANSAKALGTIYADGDPEKAPQTFDYIATRYLPSITTSLDGLGAPKKMIPYVLAEMLVKTSNRIDLMEQESPQLSKEEFNDDVYDTQDRFFKFLAKKGVIERDTIQGGTAYGALEANIPQTQYNEVHHILLAISKFIEEEKPYYTFEKQYEKELEKQLTEPLPDESTEWDPDKYHDSEKGTRVKDPYHYYGISSIYRLEE